MRTFEAATYWKVKVGKKQIRQLYAALDALKEGPRTEEEEAQCWILTGVAKSTRAPLTNINVIKEKSHLGGEAFDRAARMIREKWRESALDRDEDIEVITIGKALQSDIAKIQALQEKNLKTELAEEIRAAEGFVSLKTTTGQLDAIRKVEGIMVATSERGEVIGYEFPLSMNMAVTMPFLTPFLRNLDGLTPPGTVIEGQICVDREYRGLGLARKLHEAFRKLIEGKYQYIVTEVSSENPHSLAVHEKMGMNVLKTYSADGQKWYILGQRT